MTKTLAKIATVGVVSTALLMGSSVAFAQIDYGGGANNTGVVESQSATGTDTSTSTPGVPNTGAGDPMVLATFTLAGLAAIGGAAYLMRQRYAA